MKRIGCLVVLVLLAIGAFVFRDQIFGPRKPMQRDTAVAGPVWEPLTPARAERGRAGVAKLSGEGSPAFVSLTPGEVASYLFLVLSRQLPASADSIAATAIGDRLYVRASVKLSDLGGAGALGPLGGFLKDRERMELGGNFEVIRPGLSQFRIREIKLHELTIPSRMIPTLVKQIGKGTRPEGVAADALPLKTPLTIGDVRVLRGKVTLYKAVP